MGAAGANIKDARFLFVSGKQQTGLKEIARPSHCRGMFIKVSQSNYAPPRVLVCALTHIPSGGKAQRGRLGCMVRELLKEARQKYCNAGYKADEISRLRLLISD
jgi:hypothetical protein